MSLTETKNIILRPNLEGYMSGIGYDTYSNECIALWAQNSVTRLRWNAGVDMSTMAAGTMMGITPDFEISKASGTAKGYIGGTEISVNGHAHNYAGSNSEGGAANYLRTQYVNEINFIGIGNNDRIYFNYRNGENGSTDNEIPTNQYYFCNKNGTHHGVTLLADSFSGNASTADVAARLGENGNVNSPMTFTWNGQEGQPYWLWGTNNGVDNYVWKPENFCVRSAYYLATYSQDGDNDMDCLKKAFDYIPKSVATAVRLQHGSHSMAIGWFLDSYEYDNAYGGWFISNYGTPEWIGVDNGTWNSCKFITTNNYKGYVLPNPGDISISTGKMMLNRNDSSKYYKILASYGDDVDGMIIGLGWENSGSAFNAITMSDWDSCIGFNISSGRSLSANGSNYDYILFGSELCPGSDNSKTLGSSIKRWKQIYCATSSIVTSDRNYKQNILDLNNDLVYKFIMALKPSSYKLIDNDSNRTHYGLIAQDVEETMNELGMESTDFAGFIKSPKEEEIEVIDEKGRTHHERKVIEGEYIYALRYEEFIAPLIKMVQMQQNKINELEKEINKIKESL